MHSILHFVYANAHYSVYLLDVKKNKKKNKNKKRWGRVSFHWPIHLSIEDYTHTQRVESAKIFRLLLDSSIFTFYHLRIDGEDDEDEQEKEEESYVKSSNEKCWTNKHNVHVRSKFTLIEVK
jgi:hypothetical protein